ncbi:hypothetical protein V5738_10830 [Salinisphaera sp. SPP-AMP-43]|uniref:hypothetical protein n=1 Tax=Salinisphaera sp. SPP-AMP-43 TaxID=3121288 RepID=UPI003C6E0DD7
MNNDLLSTVLDNDPAAVGMVRQIAAVLDAWAALDDRETLLAAAWAALVEIPSNAFYRRHESSLRPMLRQMLADTQVSRVLAADGPHGQTLAFVLRDGIVGLVQHCALLVGGYDWMTRCAPEIRRGFQSMPLTDFLDRCQAAAPTIDLDTATKAELVDFARAQYGVELNRRDRADDLRAQVRALTEPNDDAA